LVWIIRCWDRIRNFGHSHPSSLRLLQRLSDAISAG